MTLYIDAREEGKHGWEKQLRHLGVDAKVAKNLDVDFLWECPAGLICVERKTWTDFVASFTGSGGADAGNRLIGQLVSGYKSAALKMLFLEGTMPQYVQAGGQVITADAMDDMSISLQWQHGVLVVHSMNLQHTPTRLAKLYYYTQKEDHKSLLRPVPPHPEEDIYMNERFRQRIAAMMCAPGMGEKGALLIASNTTSPAIAVNMSVEELLKVPGIGKVRASNFNEFWREW